MAEVTAALVKELRDKTGAGMMDCKRALGDTGGDIEGAVDWLRKKGLAAAAKKSGRVAAEGLVGVTTRGRAGAAVEVNSETDFVARNELFQAFVRTVGVLALGAAGDVEALKEAPYPATGRTVAGELTELVGRIGENLVLRRSASLAVERGVVASYVHNSLAPGLGRIGVLVALESDAEGDALAVSPAALDRERAVLREQAQASAKTEAIVERMVEGRLRKFYEEVVLLEQVFVIDGESRVGNVIEMVAKEAGAPIRVAGFVLFALGEGVDRPPSDFAAEVGAQLKN